MKITLEKAHVEDVHALDDIQKMAFKRLYDLYQDEKSPYLKGTEEMLRWLAMDKVYYFKIYYENNLCGGIAYYNAEPGEYYLARVYINPLLQGKGIAKEAIKRCEEQFRNAKKYTLDFPVDQIANKTCYEGAGYRDTGKREQINEHLTLAFYEKLV